MRQPCELFVVDRLLPTLRSEIARILYRRGMLETEIARRLGITQATVSHYIQEKRGEEGLRESLPGMAGFAELLADELASGTDGWRRAAMICEACGALRSRVPPDPEALRRAAAEQSGTWSLPSGWDASAPTSWSRQPCELVAERLLPLLRERTARFLRERYGMSQGQIAKCLNVSQPVVLGYLRSQGRRQMQEEAVEEVDARAMVLADFLASGMQAPSAVAGVCSLCTVSWVRGSGCRCARVYPYLKPLAAVGAISESA